MKESALDKLSDSKRIDPYSFLLPLSYQVAVYTKSISDSFAFLHRLDMKKRLTPDELTRREFSDALKCAQIVIREYRDASSDQFPLSSAKELVREFSLMYQQLPDKSDALTMFH